MFAVGHLALGYLTGKATSSALHVKINIPLLLLASVAPDIDFLLGLDHRGPTHSLVVQTLVFIPILVRYRRSAAPFFTSLTQHSILGDLLTGAGGVQLFWPVTSRWYGTRIHVTSILSISLELSAFLVFIVVLLITKDIRSLFRYNQYNLLFTIPVLAVILPVFLKFPLDVPTALIIPHLILLALLALSITADLRQILKIGN